MFNLDKLLNNKNIKKIQTKLNTDKKNNILFFIMLLLLFNN